MEDLLSCLENLIKSNNNQTDNFSQTPDCDNEQINNNNTEEEQNNFDFSSIDFNMIMMLGQVMESLNKQDENTNLLLALKPLIQEKKQKKIDTAINILKIISLLPLLKESGLLGGLFSDDTTK